MRVCFYEIDWRQVIPVAKYDPNHFQQRRREKEILEEHETRLTISKHLQEEPRKDTAASMNQTAH